MSIYLLPTYFMNWNHPEVLAITKTLTRGITGETEKAKQIFYFVRDDEPLERGEHAKQAKVFQ